MSQGTFIQLAALGPQDAFLYSRPGGLFPFKQCWKRPTNFALDQKEFRFPNSFVFGSSTNTLDVPRDGDFLGNMVLEIRLPALEGAANEDTWVDAVGYVLTRRVALRIDDTTIDEYERLYLDLHDDLFLPHAHKNGMDEMVGRGQVLHLNKEHILHVPLRLFCCKNHHNNQNFFPLLGVTGSIITLIIEAEKFENCVASYAGTSVPTTLDVRLLAEYAVVESFEKERILRRPIPLLVESVQDVEALSYKEVSSSNAGSVRVPLQQIDVQLDEVNSPVKLLIFVCYSTTVNKDSYFQYTDDIEEAVLFLNGQERFSPQPSGYFTLVEKFLRGRKLSSSSKNVHIYSFALSYASLHPNGTFDMSTSTNPILRVRLKEPRADRIVKCFVVTYNMLTIEKGRIHVKFI